MNAPRLLASISVAVVRSAFIASLNRNITCVVGEPVPRFGGVEDKMVGCAWTDQSKMIPTVVKKTKHSPRTRKATFFIENAIDGCQSFLSSLRHHVKQQTSR